MELDNRITNVEKRRKNRNKNSIRSQRKRIFSENDRIIIIS